MKDILIKRRGVLMYITNREFNDLKAVMKSDYMLIVVDVCNGGDGEPIDMLKVAMIKIKGGKYEGCYI